MPAAAKSRKCEKQQRPSCAESAARRGMCISNRQIKKPLHQFYMYNLQNGSAQGEILHSMRVFVVHELGGGPQVGAEDKSMVMDGG